MLRPCTIVRRRPAWLTAAAVAAALPACRPGQFASRDSLLNTGPPAVHAVHAERLAALMHELDRLTFDHVAQELEPRREHERTLAQFREHAGAVAYAAERIPDILSEVDLSPEKRDLFTGLSNKLRVQALELREAASGPRAGLRPAFDRMVATCNACHTAFRVIPALPPPAQQK